MKKSNFTATITVEWGYESHSITLAPHDWAAIKVGRPHSQRGEGYMYDGEYFWDYWRFLGGLDPELEVDYGEDGAQGFGGKLSDAVVEEHEYKPKRRAT